VRRRNVIHITEVLVDTEWKLGKSVITDFKCRRKWEPQLRFEKETEIVYLCRFTLGIVSLVPVPHTFEMNLIIISKFTFYIHTCFTVKHLGYFTYHSAVDMRCLIGISNRTSDYSLFYISSAKLRANHSVTKVYSSQFARCERSKPKCQLTTLIR